MLVFLLFFPRCLLNKFDSPGLERRVITAHLPTGPENSALSLPAGVYPVGYETFAEKPRETTKLCWWLICDCGWQLICLTIFSGNWLCSQVVLWTITKHKHLALLWPHVVPIPFTAQAVHHILKCSAGSENAEQGEKRRPCNQDPGHHAAGRPGSGRSLYPSCRCSAQPRDKSLGESAPLVSGARAREMLTDPSSQFWAQTVLEAQGLLRLIWLQNLTTLYDCLCVCLQNMNVFN